MRDTGERVSCSVKGASGSIGETGQIEDSMMERVLVMDEGEEIEADNITIVVEEMVEVVE